MNPEGFNLFKILLPKRADINEFELRLKQIGYNDKIVTYTIDKILIVNKSIT